MNNLQTNNLQTNNLQTNNFIIIDGSYFIFFRYYALIQWWSFYKKEKIENAYLNEEFLNKFKITFFEKIKEIPKKLKINNPIILVAKDCSRESIWRHAYIDGYKGTRLCDNGVSSFFKMVYNEEFFQKAGIKIINLNELEADDCIAITSKYITNKYKNNCNVYIIANDLDYLQLLDLGINIYDLKYKSIKDSKKYTGNSKQDLFCKIIMGDKSDNIPSIIPNCGLKTAIKCYQNEDFFKKKINQNKDILELFERNKKIIDFNEIPERLYNEFLLFLQNLL